MNIKLKGMCRGTGFAYILFDVSKIPHHHHLRSIVKSEQGRMLPALNYRLDELSDAPENIFVVATPLLTTTHITLAIEEVDTNHEVVAQHTWKLSRKHIKWASRLNYRLHYALMIAAQTPETHMSAHQIHIQPLAFSACGTHCERWLFKGTIRCHTGTEHLTVELINGAGEALSEGYDLQLECEQEYNLQGVPTFERGITLRFPNDGNTYCLVAKSPHEQEGIVCFSADVIEGLRAYDLNPYGMFAPAHYAKFFSQQQSILALRSEYFKEQFTAHVSHAQQAFFSIVVPLYETPPRFLAEVIESVVSQSFPSWELVLINASPENRAMQEVLARYNNDQRIVCLEQPENLGIADNTNIGIKAATGSYLCLLDHDDTLNQFALAEYFLALEANPSLDVLYCDEDFIVEEGAYMPPHFKSDFNIDLLRCHNYITHFLAVRTSLAKKLLLDNAYDGAQDYDFVLRLSELTDQIRHLPLVLYHWRVHADSTTSGSDNKSYADEAGRKALQTHADRLHLNARATCTDHPFMYRLEYALDSQPLVSIIISHNDNPEHLQRCIKSICASSTYRKLEIIIAESSNTDQDTRERYEHFQKTYDVRLLTKNETSNYSAWNNYAVSEARGDYIILIKDNIEVITPNWIETMLSVCQRTEVGAVGAKLLYPDNTIQQAGLAFVSSSPAAGYGGPCPLYSHLDKDTLGYMNRAVLRQNVIATTSACMMLKKTSFETLQGFNEHYEVAFQDVDLCLRLQQAGLLVVYEPAALLSYDVPAAHMRTRLHAADYAQFLADQGKLRLEWPEAFAKRDPYQGTLLTRALGALQEQQMQHSELSDITLTQP